MADNADETKEESSTSGDATQPSEPPTPAEQIALLEKDNQELRDRVLRNAADYENWKKRTRKEIDESAARGREALLREILPAIDNLERALQHAAVDDPLAKGVQLVEKSLLAALEKFSVTRFDPAGKPFDPALHDAIQQVENPTLPAGTVAQVFSRGYLQNGKLLRAAMVAVARSGTDEATGTAAAESKATNGSGSSLAGKEET